LFGTGVYVHSVRIHRSGSNRQRLRKAVKTPMQLTRILTFSVQTFLIAPPTSLKPGVLGGAVTCQIGTAPKPVRLEQRQCAQPPSLAQCIEL
jgi:hypothetical protein